MKGEKGVDKDNKDWSLWKSGDMWPDMKNPYVPKEKGGTSGKGFNEDRMRRAGRDNERIEGRLRLRSARR
jgi:hypothetical protein